MNRSDGEFHEEPEILEPGTESDEEPNCVKIVDPKDSPIKKPPQPSPTKCQGHLHDRPELPIYMKPASLLATQMCLNILLDSMLANSVICSKVPFAVAVNAVFVVDMSFLKSPRDLLCDDMGVWKWNGSFRKWCSVDDEGFVKILGSKLDPLVKECCYRVWKRYYFLQASPDVKKLVVMLEDCDGDTLNLAIVQYFFSEGEHQVMVAPHGNCRSGDPFFRTMPSVMSKLKAAAKNTTPKRALAFVSKEEGGVTKASTAGSLPRSRQQVKDMRRSTMDSDPLFTLMFMCKEGEGKKSEDAFVRVVNAAPFPMMLLAFDYMLRDVVRFCTNPERFSILGVDPTFSLGAFDVTVTTYRHLLLRPQSKLVGKPPVMIGPLFVHIRKDFSAYHFFASSLVGRQQQLTNLQAYGTDGEGALVNALSSVFAKATHVRCFLHFQGNIEEKLRNLKIPSAVSKEFIKDIMGSPSKLELGMVDVPNESQLDKMIADFEKVWNSREKPFNSPPVFHSWFICNCRDVIAKSMIKPIREKAGLGSPPERYYTNEVESKNNILKQQVEYRASELPVFVEHMKELLLEQKQELERAVASTGEYRLIEEHKNLCVDSSKWFLLNEEQRQRKIHKFMTAEVLPSISIPGSSHPDCPLDGLPLPSHFVKALWSKVCRLCEESSSIVQAPGDSTAWLVKSESGGRPHYVRSGKAGGYLCDDQCLSYKSSKICSHSIAVAVKGGELSKFIQWYHTVKGRPNFTALAEAGKPGTVGKKPKRKGLPKKVAERVHKSICSADESDFQWRTPIPISAHQTVLDDVTATTQEASTSMRYMHSSTPNVEPATVAVQHIVHPNVHSFQISNIGAYSTHLLPAIPSPPPLIPASAPVYSPPHPVAPTVPPPLLVPALHPNTRPTVETPFWVTFLFGNVSRCNGCKGKISRREDRRPLPPPDDIVLCHKEYVVYQNARSGIFEQSREKRNVYYHPWKTCVAPHFLDFDAFRHIKADESLQSKLLPTHQHLLEKEFGIKLFQ